MNNNYKYICLLGPDSSYNGGILEVIKQIEYSHINIKDVLFTHIGTASRKHKLYTFLKGLLHFIILCLGKRVLIAHIHMSEGASIYRTVVLITLCKFFGIKIILHSHGGMFFDQYKRFSVSKKRVIARFYNKANKIIVLTEGWKKIWMKIVDEQKIVIIPNGTKVENNVSKQYLKDGILNLLFLGNISTFKGIYDLIDAMSIVTNRCRNVKLRIAGGGEINKCKNYIKYLHLNDYIDVLGWVNGRDKENLLKKTDVLVLPSHFESFGIVAIEAMAHKIPVICGDKGFTKEIINNGDTGFIIETGNINQISDAILKCLDMETLVKLGANGSVIAYNKYRIDLVMKELESVYKECL